jgi:hypothetical protein
MPQMRSVLLPKNNALRKTHHGLRFALQVLGHVIAEMHGIRTAFQDVSGLPKNDDIPRIVRILSSAFLRVCAAFPHLGSRIKQYLAEHAPVGIYSA